MPRLKETAAPPTGASLADLERHKAQITRELEQKRGEDSKRVDKLESDLAEANEWIKARKKADEAREDQEGHTTIVVPPQTTAPTNGPETATTGEHNQPSSEENSRKGWKKLW